MRIAIERFTLPNGLRVVLAPDGRLPVAAVNLWYNVGSRNEQAGRTGLAHLFEHMMFQGSENVSGTGHIAHIERVGGNVNGSTWLDRTNYYETVPASELELALWLEADRMGRFLPALTQEKFDTQRSVVKNERRQRVDNQPYGDWDERLQRLLFAPGHPYHHPVIGSMDDLDAATLDDVRDFFRTYYAPDNAVLTVAGDFEPRYAAELVRRHFGWIPRGPGAPPLPAFRPPPLVLGAEVRETVEAEVPLARVYLACRTAPYGEADFYAADLLAELLAGGKSARLYERLVRQKRLAQNVAAFTFPTVTGAGFFVVRATSPLGGDAPALEAAVLDEISTLGRDGPLPEEMDRAMTSVAARHLIAMQRVAERADQLSMLTTHFDDPERINHELDRYRAVGADDVRRAAGTLLAERNRVVLTYLPTARSGR